ncbi:beta-lactamase family protein [Paenibacillus albidus]|uniref:serine hydrolase domain-containing protein n=1 Tax=Paenibacillus albidus TaxID=2041023 RepID=UPI001BEA5E45|nr:serine hydrolase domain-containing protein [Paenibacillus albidus]MBT2289328.1 beta-lactamase family protein [Paenibacillus albidus]
MLRKGFALILTIVLMISGSLTAFAEVKGAGGTAGTTPSGIPLSNLEPFVDDYVKNYIGKTSAGASIVIVKDGDIVLSKGYGYADVEKQIPVTPETVFEWGSISKLVVWTSVMQLAEQGKLDLNADIRTYLPDAFLTKLKYQDPITMLNLMNHNAGFEEYMFDMAYQTPEQVRTLEEGLLLAQPAQIYKPGEVVAYSNYGNSLAAYIVERISGKTFYEYAAEHVFAKLGMNHSTANPTVSDRPDLLAHKAQGYLLAGEGAFTRGSWNYMSMYPNGGNNGTAEDLAQFAMAFMPAAGASTPLFDQSDTLSEMLTQSYAAGEDMPGIAHGFWEYPGVHRTLGHGGNTIAFSTNLQLVPEERFAVVIMTNQSAEAGIVHGLTKAMLGKREAAAVSGNLPDAAELEGSYVAARRPAKGFMNLYPYLTLLKVEPAGEDQIRISLAGMTAGYKQIQPHLYEKTGGDPALDMWPMLHFQVSGGKVQSIYAYTTEYLPLPAGKTMPMLIVSAILAVVSVLYFIMAPFVLLVRAILNKRRRITRSAPLSVIHNIVVGLTLTGTGMVINNLLLAIRMLSNNERAYSEVFPQIILNYVLTGVAAVLMVAMLLFWQKKKPALSIGQKWFVRLPVIIMIIFVGLLVFWQFYS